MPILSLFRSFIFLLLFILLRNFEVFAYNLRSGRYSKNDGLTINLSYNSTSKLLVVKYNSEVLRAIPRYDENGETLLSFSLDWGEWGVKKFNLTSDKEFLEENEFEWYLKEDYNQMAIDFQPIKNQIKRMLQTKILASSSCVFPNNGIMFRYLSGQYKFLLYSQEKSISMVPGLRECIQERFLTVCLDSACMDMCSLSDLKNCVLLTIGKPLNVNSYLSPDYAFAIWLKCELLKVSLEVARHVLFVDIDIFFFQNPWKYISKLQKFRNHYDILYQWDKLPLPENSHPDSILGNSSYCYPVEILQFNSGTVYCRKSERITQYFEELMKHKPFVLNGTYLEQVAMATVAKQMDLCTSYLPPLLFRSNLHIQATSLTEWRYSKLVMLHFSGISPQNKESLMMRVLNRAKIDRNDTFLSANKKRPLVGLG